MTEESWEDWAKRQPKEYHDALKITRSFEEKRREEDRARELELARSMVGTYWKEYDTHFYKVLSVDGLGFKALRVDLGGNYFSARIDEANNPWLARQESWKDQKLSPRRITREQFFAGIKPLLDLLEAEHKT